MVPSSAPNFTPNQCNVSPLRGEKPQNRPLSKLNTGRFALRAMLPVKSKKRAKDEEVNGQGENKGRGAQAPRGAQFIIQIYTSDDIYNTFASV